MEGVMMRGERSMATAVRNAAGEITDVTVSYTEAFDEQCLRYSREYSTL